jgi:hypothetical protein
VRTTHRWTTGDDPDVTSQANARVRWARGGGRTLTYRRRSRLAFPWRLGVLLGVVVVLNVVSSHPAAADGVTARVVNDTNNRVAVGACVGLCDSVIELQTISPGSSAPITVPDDIQAFLAVIDTTQARTACIAVRLSPSSVPPEVRVSAAHPSACPTLAQLPADSGWAFALWLGAWFVATLLVGTMCVVGAVRVFNRKRTRGWQAAPALLMAWLAFLGLAIGGWIGYIPYLVIRWFRKRGQRDTAGVATVDAAGDPVP